MILTIGSERVGSWPADDLGFLLHKHPGRVQSSDLSVGTAHVAYPESGPERCTVALLLEVDPVALARSRSRTGEGPLSGYVNDRPYAASSLLAVALGRVFRTALTGRCDARPELAAQALPLTVRLPTLPCRGGGDLLDRLFAPLGWTVQARPVPLDPTVPAWGDSPYLDVTLTGRVRLADALAHLYVLLPVLDDTKHYWVGEEEVDKLVRRGGEWLANHPESALVAHRYLAHRRHLADDALERLQEVEGAVPPAAVLEAGAEEAPTPLRVARREAVLAEVEASGATTVADLGCGQGHLLAALLADPRYRRVVGTDVSARALAQTARTLRLDRLPDPQRRRLEVFQSSLTYRDARLGGLDAVVLSEVVEHVDPPRLPALERVVFGEAAPGTVVVTTPNREHNVRYPSLFPTGFRHADHRFEWTRAEFAAWAREVAERYGYTARTRPVGPDDPEVGAPTQLAVFTRVSTAADDTDDEGGDA